MKSTLKLLALSAIAATALGSCSNDDEIFELSGEGTLFLSTTMDHEVKSRASATLDQLKENSIIWIANSKGLVREYYGLSEVPENGIKLLADNYTASVWAGDSVPASFTDRYFKGTESFEIRKGDNKSVNVTCRYANSVVAVNYADEIDDVLTDYTLTVGHSQGSLTFEGKDERMGYFMMNSRDKDLTWTLNGKLLSGEEYTRSGKIEACKPATLYTLNIKCSTSGVEIGSAYLTVDIDETEIEFQTEIPIIAAPKVKGINFDLATPIRAEKGTVGRRSLWISASTELKGLVLTCDYFRDLLAIDGNDFDLIQMTDPALPQRIEDAGITYDLHTYPVDDQNPDSSEKMTTVKLNFGEAFTNTLPDGEYAIRVDAIDANGKTGSGTLTIIISDAPVSTGSCDPASVWTTKATISGEITKADAANPVLCYRKLGTVTWIKAETTINGNAMTATLTGLEPATTYEYAACADNFEGSVASFTTDGTPQLANAGFEDWYTYENNKLWDFGPEGSEKFWDSGNTALKAYSLIVSLDKNPTSKDETVKHSGNSSVRLKSISIVGQFAAGNMFIGEFIRTDGTNGVIGWGRHWTTRPAKLKGWAKYSPVNVTKENGDYTDLKKGDPDKGIVYIALLDNSVLKEDSGKQYPVIIKTNPKTKPNGRELFDKNASNVIAYGELVFNEATNGDGMVEFEIPLNYYRTDIKPTYIMVTASASIGGDYFVGGEGSTLWLDDLELVY